MSEKNTNKAIDFEAAVKRLDEISSLMSRSGVSLDESLALYEEGVALVRECNKKLDSTERRIKMLRLSADGELTEVDMPPMAEGDN